MSRRDVSDVYDWRSEVCKRCEKSQFSFLGSVGKDGWYHGKGWEEQRRVMLRERRSLPRAQRWVSRRVVVRM